MDGGLSPALLAELRRACGADWVFTQEHQLRTYESDGLLQYHALPAAAVLPGSAEQVQAVVRACAREGVPWVARGSGSGLSDVLMAATNSSGGVLGKMISPQNLAIAAAAVGMNGKEGDIFRRVVVWSVAFLALLCVLSALQASVLSWMVP